MTLYVIGFRNGGRIELDLRNGSTFIDGIRVGIANAPSAPQQWYSEPSLLLNVSEIAFILPSAAIAKATGELK